VRIPFEATDGGFEDDGDALIWSVFGGGHYLTLQRDSEGSGSDWGVYLEYDDQANGEKSDIVRRAKALIFSR
jgi:hypothetical protein